MDLNVFETQKQACKDAISEALDTVKFLPKSREQALVLTKLDEARLWLSEAKNPPELPKA